MHRKQSYHTNFKIKYRLGLLPESEMNFVPPSTLRYWNGIDFSVMIGFDSNDPFMENLDFHKAFLAKTSLIKIAKCLWWLYITYSSTLEKLRGWKKKMREQKEMIMQCVQRIAPTLGYERACRMLKISYQQFFRWKQAIACNKSLFQLCKRITPQQLAMSEQETVEKYLSDNYSSLLHRYYKMMRDGAAYMGLQTFYRYARRLNVTRNLLKKKRARTGIRSSCPFELLHIDTTIYKLSNLTRVYIHFVTDNFSRAILSYSASLEWNSRHTVENLKTVCETHNLYYRPLLLMCDDGSENKGEVNTFLLQPNVQMKRLIAQIETSYSNSIAEAVNKKMKYDFLFTRSFDRYEELVKFIDVSVEEYNNRYHSALYGYTPSEVLNGAVPDKHKFSLMIAQARKERILKNKEQLCEQCAPKEENEKIQ
ncbi:MAG: DDE-type integrase/transposase/recombinase [Bacteroidetes bacterium]|nr:DDE-type integrase/transposase/recombinase [Bacteroidota bacterium]